MKMGLSPAAPSPLIETCSRLSFLSCALAFLVQTACSLQRGTANAEIRKTCLRHFRLRENVASVQNNWRAQKALDADQIETRKFLPLCQDQQRIGPIGGSVGVRCIVDSVAKNLSRPLDCGWIESCDVALFFQ